jgi:hypothetical protein
MQQSVAMRKEGFEYKDGSNATRLPWIHDDYEITRALKSFEYGRQR